MDITSIYPSPKYSASMQSLCREQLVIQSVGIDAIGGAFQDVGNNLSISNTILLLMKSQMLFHRVLYAEIHYGLFYEVYIQ